MARQILGCPATSASVERIFSVAGQLLGDLSRHLDDGCLEEMVSACINNGGRKYKLAKLSAQLTGYASYFFQLKFMSEIRIVSVEI